MRPHFVFTLADDLGDADLGCYGRRAPCSPELDRMAAGADLISERAADSGGEVWW